MLAAVVVPNRRALVWRPRVSSEKIWENVGPARATTGSRENSESGSAGPGETYSMN